MTQIWPKRAIFEFSQKIRKRNFFRTPKTRLSIKNQQILINGLQKNAKNLHFWAFWAKMSNFGRFLAKMGKTVIFFKKALGTFFSRLQALTNCKVSEKCNERFSSNRVTDARTHVLTDVNPQVSNERPKNLIFRLFKKIKGIIGD